MTDKELRKLSRAQLLELLLVQSQELDHLREELADAKEKLNHRELTMERCGSIAEASLALTEIFENAQRAADQYLENIKLRAADPDAVLLPEDVSKPLHDKPEPPKNDTFSRSAGPQPAEAQSPAEDPLPDLNSTLETIPLPDLEGLEGPVPQPDTQEIVIPSPEEYLVQGKITETPHESDEPADPEEAEMTFTEAAENDSQTSEIIVNEQESLEKYEEEHETVTGTASLDGTAGTGTDPGKKPEEIWEGTSKHRIHPSVSSRRSNSGSNFISSCHAYLRKLHGSDAERRGNRGVAKKQQSKDGRHRRVLLQQQGSGKKSDLRPGRLDQHSGRRNSDR